MEVKAGMQGYYAIGSDTYPITVTKVSKSKKVIYARFENFVGDTENGHDYYGKQVWKILENPNGRIEKFTWTPTRNRYTQQGSGSVGLGEWKAKQDPGF